MNTPIIDPMLFYWINVLENLSCLPHVLVLLLIIVFFGGLLYTDCVIYEERDAYKKAHRKLLKVLLYITFIVFFLSFFIPSKETMFSILIAEQITPANIESFGNNADKLLDVLAEKVIYIGKELK